MDYSFNPVIIEKIFADIAFSTTRISTEKRTTIIDFYYNTAIFMKHPCIVLKEQKLTIADRWEKGKLSRLVITYFFLISFPWYAVWWICYNYIKLFSLKGKVVKVLPYLISASSRNRDSILAKAKRASFHSLPFAAIYLYPISFKRSATPKGD